MSTGNKPMSILQQFISTTTSQQNSNMEPETLGYVYCSSSYSSSYSVYCPDSCCYTDSNRYYPYCCSSSDYVAAYIWVSVIIVVVVAVTIVGIVQCRKRRNIQRQPMYRPIGVQPIIKPRNIENQNPNPKAVVGAPYYQTQNVPIY